MLLQLSCRKCFIVVIWMPCDNKCLLIFRFQGPHEKQNFVQTIRNFQLCILRWDKVSRFQGSYGKGHFVQIIVRTFCVTSLLTSWTRYCCISARVFMFSSYMGTLFWLNCIQTIYVLYSLMDNFNFSLLLCLNMYLRNALCWCTKCFMSFF